MRTDNPAARVPRAELVRQVQQMELAEPLATGELALGPLLEQRALKAQRRVPQALHREDNPASIKPSPTKASRKVPSIRRDKTNSDKLSSRGLTSMAPAKLPGLMIKQPASNST